MFGFGKKKIDMNEKEHIVCNVCDFFKEDGPSLDSTHYCKKHKRMIDKFAMRGQYEEVPGWCQLLKNC